MARATFFMFPLVTDGAQHVIGPSSMPSALLMPVPHESTGELPSPRNLARFRTSDSVESSSAPRVMAPTDASSPYRCHASPRLRCVRGTGGE